MSCHFYIIIRPLRNICVFSDERKFHSFDPIRIFSQFLGMPPVNVISEWLLSILKGFTINCLGSLLLYSYAYKSLKLKNLLECNKMSLFSLLIYFHSFHRYKYDFYEYLYLKFMERTHISFIIWITSLIRQLWKVLLNCNYLIIELLKLIYI